MSEDKKDIERITAYRKMAAMGVTTIRQAVCLLAINYQHLINTTELAKVIGINRASTIALIVRLKEKGLISWTFSGNPGRIKGRRKDSRIYHLTDAGRKAVEEGRKA